MLLDYHAKHLMPIVWGPDGFLTKRFIAKIKELWVRFEEASDIAIVGDAVSHYWMHNSPIDIFVFVPENLVERNKQIAYRLDLKIPQHENNPIVPHIISNHVAPSVLAQHYGPVFSIAHNKWFGKVVNDQTELLQPKALLRYINWRIQRERYTESLLDDVNWRIIKEAFSLLKPKERESILDALKNRIAVLESKIKRKVAKQSKEIIKQVDEFEQRLIEEEEIFDQKKIPEDIAQLLIHKMRYLIMQETLEDLHDLLSERERQHKKMAYTVDMIGSVVVEGGQKSIRKLNDQLRAAGFDSDIYRDNALVVSNVPLSNFDYLQSFVKPMEPNVRIMEIKHNYKIAEKHISTASEESNKDENENEDNTFIDIIEGGYYKVKSDKFSLMRVDRLWTDNGERKYDLSLISPEGKEYTVTAEKEFVHSLEPKKAGIEDFLDLGLIPPANLSYNPHL